MKLRSLFIFVVMIALATVLGACNNGEKTSSNAKTEEKETKDNKQTITYLGKTYEVPAKIDKIATAGLESMEDAAVLDIKPVAAITMGDKVPEFLAGKLGNPKPIGSKMQPDAEALLKIKPDVILWSSKGQPEVTKNPEKVAPTFPYSHIASNWEENLRLLGKLSGREDKAEEAIKQYKADAESAKKEVGESLKNKDVVVMRLRNGSLFVYQKDIYFNPVLYEDMGLQIPKMIEAAKAQEQISLEKFAKMDPDYIFLQSAESENAANPKALEDLQSNPIWKNLTAVKNNHVYVNAVEPLAQGGTAWSKQEFLKSASAKLTE